MENLIEHDCPVEGLMMVEKGKPCNWCDELDYLIEEGEGGSDDN